MKTINTLLFGLSSMFCFSQIDITVFNHHYHKNKKAIMIYFYTDWCSICKIQENQLERNFQLRDKLNKEVYFLKIDAESCEELTFLNHTYSSNNTTYRKNTHDFVYEFIHPKEVNFPLWVIIDKKINVIGIYTGLIQSKELIQIINKIKKE